MLKMYFFGSPRLVQQEQSVELDTRKAMALLAYLAHTAKAQSRDTLATFLWPEFDDRHAKGALRRTLSTLKGAVGEGYFQINRETVGLVDGAVWCDVSDFRRLLAGRPDLPALEKAIALYRDDFLVGFSLRDSLPFDHWQLLEAENLRRELSLALDKVCHYYLMEHQFEIAIRFGLRWLEMDPLREESHRLLMKLFAWSGQRSAALNQYRRCVRLLEGELGVLPLAETTALYQQIQREQLPAAPTRPSSSPVISYIAGSHSTDLSLVGRQAELADMGQFYAQIGPAGRFLAVMGEAGIGKTALCQTFLTHSPSSNLAVRCYRGESHLAYAPIGQALREVLKRPEMVERLRSVPTPWLVEVSRLLPELLSYFPHLTSPSVLDWPGASARFLEGISQVVEALLVSDRPAILWLDDGQWADSASLDWLTFFVRRLQDRPFMVLVCWRETEIGGDHPLRLLLGETRRLGTGRSLLLPRLNLSQVQEMAAATTISPQRLFQETEGVPILVREYLALWQHGDRPDNWQLPPTSRDLFHSRLAQVDDAGRQLLQTAAVIGRPSDFELLQQVSGRSEEEVLSGLEQLVWRGILAERAEADGPSYHFSHHKLAELVYQETTLLRHRLLHKRVAQTLAGRPRTDGLAGEIAHHYQHAGQEKEAALYYRRAGDEAQTLFAHQEALHYYQMALALAHPEPALLHELCADLHTRRGQYRAALASYEQAAALTPLPRLEHKIGQVYYRQGVWESAESHFTQAESQWQGDDLARLYVDWSYLAYRQGQLTKARERAGRGQALVASPQTQAHIHNILGILNRHEGALEVAGHHFEDSYRLAEQHGWLDLQITALNNLALVEASGKRSAKAQQWLEMALHHCQNYGDRHWQAALHNNLADLLHQLGDQAGAMVQLKQAVAIYAEIGQAAGDWQPEIWKLTEW